MYIIAILLVLFSCVKEDHFGLSPYGNIKKFLVSNQAGNATIDTDLKTVTIEIPGGVELSSLVIQELELSSFATADKAVGDVIDLSSDATITVIAEDGSTTAWIIETFVASATPQLDNGDLNTWYKTSSGYYEPGTDAASTIWGTGNPGTQILGKIATTPYDLGSGNMAALMETYDLGLAGVPLKTPIAAGSLFTGYFDSDKLDPTDPEAAIAFGTPFTGRPDKIRFTYSYVPGDVNEDRYGNVLDYGDNCDIYAFLEVRLGGTTQRLGTAWFRSDENQSEMITREIEFVYGPLDDSYPDYMSPDDGNFVSGDSATYMLPTHITFVASSSYDGANFAGAVGSKLLIDDVVLVYDEE
ncbi:PCMD domain-containing protein [Draconibacterium sp. IB214405]|uniref:PCMD domain-containing protein n=1 Tax=Draconibacterium sp. IB214405 TaxID=3097352 RepID=UPI002A0ED451|nr:PCMD domain-containing protein [Draconibacterium sp. IB214405]MDX8337932.1 PCMD domain-containing protein [Draconibacterium sp. IB214405]